MRFFVNLEWISIQPEAMKKYVLFLLSMAILAGSQAQQQNQISKRKYSRLVKKTKHKLEEFAEKQCEAMGKDSSEANEEETPMQYWIDQYLATMDPALGRPTPEVLIPTLQNLYKPGISTRAAAGISATPWVERGPNNVGGRTRALAWDPWDASGKKVWAGGVSGGLWYNNDITSASSKWVPVQSLWSNLSISAIAFGPIGKDTIYVGTGEPIGSSSFTRGLGIWKSTDGGKTFSMLTSTSIFYYCSDIVVRNENGQSVVYATIIPNYYQGAWHGSADYGLYRSTNGGSTWTNVGPTASNSSKYCFSDMELAADGRLWLGTTKNIGTGFDLGGGRVMYTDDGTNFNVVFKGYQSGTSSSQSSGRVEIACAPSSKYTVYAAIERAGALDSIVVTTNRGSTFGAKTEPDDADNGITAKDFTRGQAWYDLILAVDPNDSSTCIIGGVDLFRTTNKGSNWTQISKWSNNPNLNTLSCPLVHADQHAISYKPGSSSAVIFGCDGGVYYSSSISSASSSSTAISSRNKGYNVTQFYWGDFAAGSGSNEMIAGAQDNGSQRFTSAGVNSTTEVTGGDGAFCFISPSNSSKQISSYVYNTYYYTLDNWSNANSFISKSNLGKFINPAEWDDNGPGLFTHRSSGMLYRKKLTTSPGALDSITYKSSSSDLTSAIYAQVLSNGKTRLLVGNDAGTVYITQDAWATTPTFTSKLIQSGTISGFNAVGTSDTMAVVFSNYGTTNILTSVNGGSTWTGRDGNLPNMPVWGIVLNPQKPGQAIIATELGTWGTTNLFAASPTWTADTAGIGPVKVATIRYRKSDQMLMAVTHGRGVFTNDGWSKTTPIALFGADARAVCTNKIVSLLDSSQNSPTTWAWSISPNTFVYTNGTDSTNQNPKVRFTAGGTYSITLNCGNSLGNNSLTRTSLIVATDTVIGTGTLTLSRNTNCQGDTVTLISGISAALNGSITSYTWYRNNSTTAGNTSTLVVTPTPKDSFYVKMVSNKYCVSPSTFSTKVAKPAVQPLVTATAKVTASQGCANVPLTVNVAGTNTGASPSWDWYVNGSLQSGHSSSLVISAPVNGAKVYATINVAGMCVMPANQIYSDTPTLVVYPKPATPSVSRNLDTLIASNVGNGTYTWYRSGALKGTGRKYKTNQNGTYKCVYSENGCFGDSSTAIVFNSLFADPLSKNGIYLTPNPVQNWLNVNGVTQLMGVKVYAGNGALVLSNPETQGQNGMVQVNVSTLPAGVYIIEFEQNGWKLAARFTKN